MKFCRNCGSALQGASQPGVPAGMMAPPGPIASPPQHMGMPHMPPGPLATPGPMGGPASRAGMHADLPPTIPPSVAPQNKPIPGTPSGPRAAAASPGERTVTCPRCGTPTPMGFAYCQQCGLHMSALQPTDPGAGLVGRARAPSAAPPIGQAGAVANTLPQQPPQPQQRPPSGGQPQVKMPIDPQAATMATDGPRPNMMPPTAAAPMAPPVSSQRQAAGPAASGAPAWGTAVLVNRDGSDGQRYPLAGEYLVVGRNGADIAFDDDRFLARQHARLERAADGSVKVLPIDTLNGVFRKADAPIDLSDGMVILVGREVLRFERVDGEEAKVHPLVRHGVALFGSPPREPWGRLVQIIPSGGHRDVRHLVGEEIVLGREEGDIVFRDDAFMSRRHAAVTWDGKRAQVTDLGSSNGTFVRVTAPTPVKHGDHVRMGDQLLRIELGR
ncbi:MAG: FHA domain-containing protein [Myxococcota bacterium]|nr:FHA domain-containing protein [Myxococcota bacterium]